MKKRIIGLILALIMLLGAIVPVVMALSDIHASAQEDALAPRGEKIVFTNASVFDVGGKVKVDGNKTFDCILSDCTSDEYNAFLEGNVQYYWMRNGIYHSDGNTLKITEKDRGCEFYCVGALYSDADHTQQCATIVSKKFTVPNPTIPEITTSALPNGKVGEAYYYKLDCTDPDVTYSLFRSSLPDGLTLTQHGEIEGTPTKAGMWYVVVMVTPEAGADYANTEEFEFTIEETPAPAYSLEVLEYPKKDVYTAGEKLDMTGLHVIIHTPSGDIESRDGQHLTYSQKELVTVGEQKIKISYEDAFEFFIVTVKAAPVTEPTPPVSDTTAPTVSETTPSVSDTTAPTVAETTPSVSDTTAPTVAETTPSVSDTTATDATTTKADDTSAPADGGCGSALAAALLPTVAAAALVALRRKREQ
jgi:hypothetical protein